MVGLAIITLFVLVAVLAPVIAPYDPLERDPGARSSAAERRTTRWARTARCATSVQPDPVRRPDQPRRRRRRRSLMGLAIGGTIGASPAAFGGKVDTVLMRVVDVLLAIPGILLAIGIVAWLDRGLPQIMFAVAVTNVPIFARILRGSMLVAARVGLRDRRRGRSARPTSRLLLRHMLPNSLTAAHRGRHARPRDGDHRRRGPRVPGPRAGGPADPGVGDDADRLPRASTARRRG